MYQFNYRYLAESYSLVHHEMAKQHEKCDQKEQDFKNGITNGAAWYSVPGGRLMRKNLNL